MEVVEIVWLDKPKLGITIRIYYPHVSKEYVYVRRNATQTTSLQINIGPRINIQYHYSSD